MRVAALLLRPVAAHRPPPGVSAEAWADALAEDTYEVISALAGLDPAVICAPPDQRRAEALVWPGTPIHVLRESDQDGTAARGLDLLMDAGAHSAIIVADDVPDLPGLLVGKLFSALSGCPVAACPAAGGTRTMGAAGGSLVALAARVPLARWLPALSLDSDDALDQLHGAAPPGELTITPGWGRLRSAADIELLDDGLEGWPATRAVLRR